MRMQPCSQIDFLVLGAQKCATTWLYDCLSEHPELYLPAKKREIWYLGGDLYEKNGAEWYLNFFVNARDGQRAGDVSVEYLFDPRAATAVEMHAPAARLIVSLRDPINRAISAYFWNLRRSMIADISVEESLARGLAEAESSRADLGVYGEMIVRGAYGSQLERYTSRFGTERILYVLYEDIVSDPMGTLQRIFQFLGVDTGVRPANLGTRPKKNTYSQTLARLQRLAPQSRLITYAMDRLNQWLAHRWETKKVPHISSSLEDRLREYYAPSVAMTEELISRAPQEHRPVSDISTRWRSAD